MPSVFLRRSRSTSTPRRSRCLKEVGRFWRELRGLLSKPEAYQSSALVAAAAFSPPLSPAVRPWAVSAALLSTFRLTWTCDWLQAPSLAVEQHNPLTPCPQQKTSPRENPPKKMPRALGRGGHVATQNIELRNPLSLSLPASSNVSLQVVILWLLEHPQQQLPERNRHIPPVGVNCGDVVAEHQPQPPSPPRPSQTRRKTRLESVPPLPAFASDEHASLIWLGVTYLPARSRSFGLWRFDRVPRASSHPPTTPRQPSRPPCAVPRCPGTLSSTGPPITAIPPPRPGPSHSI
jgi:hypothetical protein